MMEVRDDDGKLLGYLPSIKYGTSYRYPGDIELKLGLYSAPCILAGDVPIETLRRFTRWQEPTEIEARRDVVNVLGPMEKRK